ncbi:hypothetical protein RJ639_041026 [Escallonia herrerae]|uniref:Senescence regulator S40 n=1 Tax=Escallonia herrerae TaxID=1293975 RepID=A0AA88WEP9_9ASTE|nr:hypothetical protein RJ639_041026 [Escallonia herrerae]
MEGRYGLYSQGSSGWTSLRNEEFQEADVWAVLKEREDLNSKVGTSKESSTFTFTSRILPTAARMVPRANKSNPTHESKLIQQSAPVKIPDWSKIYGKHSKEASEHAPRLDCDDYGGNGCMRGSSDSDEEDDDVDGSMMPPHEWIAKKLARSQISSFSVCEGVGRTLKGRDQSRVRNAVLTQTGFLEQY